ncbi:Sec8 exocyst complex component-specific domain-containing protein [Melanogaster broomeanus]|nr:Sec8 exocyst complex component-specific domain-containing protein [Melanogaster broomeanus]
MSRVPAFPLEPQRRTRTPSISRPIPNPLNYPTSLPSTRPLQITRPPSHPTTPSNGTFTSSSPKPSITSSPKGPHRPQRSELRPRQASDYSASEQASTSSRLTNDLNGRERHDSSSTTRSDASIHQRPANGTVYLGNRPALDPRSVTNVSEESGISPVSPSTTSPALSAVMAAFRDAGEASARRRGTDELDYERGRRMEEEMIRQERIKERMPYRKPTGKAKAGDIDAVLDQIRDEWEFVIDPDFNNVDLALSLLDESSTGKSMNSFRKTKQMLAEALKGSVDKHYKAFADALPQHAGFLNHLGQAQAQVQETRTALQEAKESLGSKRADLVQLWSRGQTLEEMMRLLDQIEHLKFVPDALETLISEKRLIQAAVLLVRSLKLINKPDMQEIGAVADLRSYLVGQETALREILVDELHNHLYLKSFWCETRWTAYTPGQSTFSKVEFEDKSAQSGASNGAPRVSETFPSHDTQTSRLSHYLTGLATRPNDPPHDLDDTNFQGSVTVQEISISLSVSSTSLQFSKANANPEADSFTYMETLLESLAVLGKLGSALDIVMQRLQSEIFSLVESTVDEVAERAEESKRSSNQSPSPRFIQLLLQKGMSTRASALRLAALESSSKHRDQEILRDLFWTVYSKLDAVTQGLRVVFELKFVLSDGTLRILWALKPGALFPIADVWLPVQAEVRTLLHDYLTDEERSAVAGRNPITSINEGIFRFSDTDTKTTERSFGKHEDELMRALRDTNARARPEFLRRTWDRVYYPLSGLMNEHLVLDSITTANQTGCVHVSVLFQPTLAFLGRVANVLPDGMESARSASDVLEEFVLKVYLPQLEEKISLLFHQAISSPDAFPARHLIKPGSAPQPVLKQLQLYSQLLTFPMDGASSAATILQLIEVANKLYGLVDSVINAQSSRDKLIKHIKIIITAASSVKEILESSQSSDCDTLRTEWLADDGPPAHCMKVFNDLLLALRERKIKAAIQTFDQYRSYFQQFLGVENWKSMKQIGETQAERFREIAANTSMSITEIRETHDVLEAFASRVDDGVHSVKASQDETKAIALEVNQGVRAIAIHLARESELTKSEQLNATQTEQLKTVLEWFNPFDCTVKHETTLRQRQEQTCGWLFNVQQFIDWRSSLSQFIWLNGKPGAGKSVLAAAVIEKLSGSLQCGETLAYFYCDFGNSRCTSPKEVMSSLVFQFLRSASGNWLSLFPELKERMDRKAAPPRH